MIDFTPTNSYLDDCMFNQMIEHTQKHPDKPRSAEKWILKGSNYHKPTCVSATFDSLVKLGLLGKVPKLLGTCINYPTLNPGNIGVGEAGKSWGILYFLPSLPLDIGVSICIYRAHYVKKQSPYSARGFDSYMWWGICNRNLPEKSSVPHKPVLPLPPLSLSFTTHGFN